MSKKKESWVLEDNRAERSEKVSGWEINGEQSSGRESQVHEESMPAPNWIPFSATPSRVEKTVTTSTATADITIEDVEEELPSDDRQTYCVTFFGDQIRTTLTRVASVVDHWIADIRRVHQEKFDQKQLVVGLDLEWRPSFSRSVEHRVAVLQLCVEGNCLIFQLLYADRIPTSLIEFLSNPSLTFVGVGIQGDVEKLLVDHELNVVNTVDLRSLAAKKLSIPELRDAGLKELTREVLGKEIGKPRKVTMSRWDAEWLTYDQVQYASLDAFLSFQIGKNLILGGGVGSG
ncbi:Werner Syndrome-like exonuclease [Macadamia integrifolia]|uniref:Werner Syndrome-like exonuclease n=1 Tax=Macadamia integrifolia TaxID=60698 RepID=UPI001C532302|nr:Werner Syndrome-like exonuclease [Macadamia integrifolia]